MEGRPRGARSRDDAGFTIVELLTAVTIVALLAGMAIFKSRVAIEQAKIAKAIGDIRAIQAEIQSVEAGTNPLPLSLAEIGRDQFFDPWGRPYQYLNFEAVNGKGKGVPAGARRDRFLVPINSTFDLYSLGPDGASAPPLPAAKSHDDIVRANDGGFIGVARKF